MCVCVCFIYCNSEITKSYIKYGGMDKKYMYKLTGNK